MTHRPPSPARSTLAAGVLLALTLALFCAAAPAGADEPAPPAERPPAMQRLLDQLQQMVDPALLAPAGAAADVEGDLDRVRASEPPLAAADPLAPDLPGGLAGDLAAAVADYRESGEPAILGTPTGRVWPYGHGVPTLTCLPLRACDVALEAGETLLGWAIGDSERWLAEELVEGAPPGERPHLLLKPTETGLATNLVLVTDRRTYHLELVSPELPDDAAVATPYDHRVAWYYPDDWVRRLEHAERRATTATADAAVRHAEAVELEHPLDPGRLSFAYRVDAPFWARRRLPWRPLTVFDDGERVYLRLPERARRHELPVLLGRLADGTTYPLATHLAGDWLIVPTLFERAELVLGTGDRRRSLTLRAGSREAAR